MAVSIAKLFSKCAVLYQMTLLAGRGGMTNPVQWVHIIEDENVPAFLHGGELVFTAGIRSAQEPDWFSCFIHNVSAAGAAGVVVNIGPHIDSVPEEIVAYCEEADLPLFTVPWQIRMVDMTRDFCQRIIDSESRESSLATAIKNILFSVGDQQDQLQQVERYGCRDDSRVRFLCISSGEEDNPLDPLLQQRLENLAARAGRPAQELLPHFVYQNRLVLVLVDYTDVDLERFLEIFFQWLDTDTAGALHIGISSAGCGYADWNRHFKNGMQASRMAVRQNQTIIRYDTLGLRRLLLQVDDRELLEEEYREIVGRVEEYDRENGTQLLDFLRCYMEHNGSVAQVAEALYVHRNTVGNMLRKIEKITGHNLQEMESRLQCAIGFYIQEIL